MIRIALHLLS